MRKPGAKYRESPSGTSARGRSGASTTSAAIARRLSRLRLAPEELRWSCDPREFSFRSTREVPGKFRTPGFEPALATLKMGLGLEGPGFNLFLCGLHGTRKLDLVERLVRERVRGRSTPPDLCFVQRFDDPRRPALLELPRGDGARLEKGVRKLLETLQVRLEKLDEKLWLPRARAVLEQHLPRLTRRFGKTPAVRKWLAQWKRELLRTLRHLAVEDFEVATITTSSRTVRRPIVVETQPTHARIFGWIGRRAIGDQSPEPHFTAVRSGSFLDANGGVLIIDANDLAGHPNAWTQLKACLRYGSLSLVEGDSSSSSRNGSLQPDPIPTNVKVVLVGDHALYDWLFENDSDFAELFKIRVDFPAEVTRTKKILSQDYPALISSICETAKLRPVAASGVASVLEFATRRAGRQNKVTTNFAMIEDLLREADYWAGQSRRRSIVAEDVDRSVREAIDRVNLVERRISEMILDGTILISTSGSRVGQVNGLAIYDMGDYFFGKPSRITAETSVGFGGIINIERESGFSGRIHDKGVQILAGYLRSCFAQSRPLSLTASVCFEQSYSGVDGDSASTTEIFAILSSLSGLPIRQDVAVTGSLSQKGDIQPIGAVNEKIEGFFDCVQQAGRPSGTEGVLIPRKNVSDLMLRDDVVRAVKDGRFHVWAVETIQEGIEILTGVEAGRRGRNGEYPPESVFGRVDRRLEKMASDLRRYRGDQAE